MFGKLIKYELKSAGKWYVSLYAGTIVIAALLGFVIQKTLKASLDAEFEVTASDALTLLLIMVFIALLSGLFLSTLIMIITRFNRNIYGREGYLTLTLPVSHHHIILSKLCTSVLWTFLNGVVLGFSTLLLVLPSMGLGNLLSALPRLRPYLFSSQAGLFILLMLVSTLSSILLIYMAISIGQLFQDRRGLMGFVAYFVITVILSFISNQLNSAFVAPHIEIYNESAVFMMDQYLIVNIILNIVTSLLFYFGTHYIMKHKINIQ